jgi:CRP/FNR family transcriptional regulator, cyclic AMP receptor protein
MTKVTVDSRDASLEPSGTEASRLAQLLPNLPPAVICRLAARIRTTDHPPSDVMIRRGARDRVGVMTDGLARTSILSPEGRMGAVLYHRRGELLGVASLFQPMPADVVALERTSVIWLEGAALAQMAKHSADLGWQLAAAASEWGVHLSVAAEEFAFGSVKRRIATHLLLLASPQRHGGGPSVARITQQELADSIGSVREVVARTLATYTRLGIIVVSKRKITVLDDRALLRLSQ